MFVASHTEFLMVAFLSVVMGAYFTFKLWVSERESQKLKYKVPFMKMTTDYS